MASPTVSVVASGRREEFPDQATVKAVAIGTGESTTVALASARDCAATIRAAVEAVDSDQIRTVDLQVDDTDEMFDPATDAAYEATARLEIRCAPRVADEVVANVADGGGRVRRIEWELQDERCQALRDEAVRAATERAREKAKQIAAAQGVSLTGVRDISTTEPPTRETGLVDIAIDDSPDANLQPTSIEVVEAVEAVYEVSEE